MSLAPDALGAYPGDFVDQSAILRDLVGTSMHDRSYEDRFNATRIRNLMLSKLRDIYERDDEDAALNLLSSRNSLKVDPDFRIPLGRGRVIMDADLSMLDYHLTVAKGLGFSSLLPNSPSSPRFELALDLKKPYRTFKGKHAMLGFDPAGRMLFIGRCCNEDVFLAMAPNDLLRGHVAPSPPGRSTASSNMSKRHYRQMVMFFAHFLAEIPELSFQVTESVYLQNLTSSEPKFWKVTNALYVFFLSPFPSSLLPCP